MSKRHSMEHRRILERDFCKGVPTRSLEIAKQMNLTAIQLISTFAEQHNAGTNTDPDTPTADATQPGESS